MSKILTELKKYSIIIIAITAILGSLLIAMPDKMLAYTALFIGGAFTACGIFALISYITSQIKSKLTLVLGVISAVSGIIICLAYKQIMTVIIFLIGLFLLAGGIVDLINSIYVSVNRHRSWLLTVLLAFSSIVLGLVSIFNPFDTQIAIVRFIGIGLIIFSITDLVAYIQVRKLAKEIKEKAMLEDLEGNAKEVDYNEVDDN